MAKKKLPITTDNIDIIRKRYIIAALRRVTLYWPPRAEAMSNARIERGLYECANCKKAFGRKEIQVDHIVPAVKITGFTNWQDYVERMFPMATGLQILCVGCHTEKTQSEQILRKIKKSVDKNKKS